MSLFDDLVANETIASVRSRIVEHAKAAELAITNWIKGSVGHQFVEVATLATYEVGSRFSKIIRGFASLDTSVDPGDEDPFDPANVDLEPSPGFLSSYGKGTFGTPRGEATFATGFVTFTTGDVPRTLAPRSLTFTWTEGLDVPDPAPTYRNSADPAIYTNGDGTVTVPAGSSLEIPVRADAIGTGSNAPTGALSLTTTLSGCSATNDSPIRGVDRESAANYRARCRQAPSRISLGGPSAAYEYLAKTQIDGSPLLNASGNVVNISRVWVSPESATGDVNVYFASPGGAAVAEDVEAANENIEQQAFAAPGAISFTGAAATEVEIAVAGNAKLKAAPGVTTAAAKLAIVEHLTAWFAALEIGGRDQDANGAGVVYDHDIRAVAACSYPGLYAVSLENPGDETALATGEVAVLSTNVASWSVVLV